jgi:hypothetical protein
LDVSTAHIRDIISALEKGSLTPLEVWELSSTVDRELEGLICVSVPWPRKEFLEFPTQALGKGD